VTGVVEVCRPDGVLVEDGEVVEEATVLEVLAVELLVPGSVCALTAPNTPTPTSALAAAPVVSRFRRRMAASRARTLAWVASSVSIV
jgi:hypothetical protein